MGKIYVVDVYVDEVLCDVNVFLTRRQAINYVSGEFIYYEKKYETKLDDGTEQLNLTTTLTKPIRELNYDKGENETCYCEPFDDDLVWAYVDTIYGLYEWEIREVGI